MHLSERVSAQWDGYRYRIAVNGNCIWYEQRHETNQTGYRSPITMPCDVMTWRYWHLTDSNTCYKFRWLYESVRVISVASILRWDLINLIALSNRRLRMGACSVLGEHVPPVQIDRVVSVRVLIAQLTQVLQSIARHTHAGLLSLSPIESVLSRPCLSIPPETVTLLIIMMTILLLLMITSIAVADTSCSTNYSMCSSDAHLSYWAHRISWWICQSYVVVFYVAVILSVSVRSLMMFRMAVLVVQLLLSRNVVLVASQLERVDVVIHRVPSSFVVP